MARNVNAEIIAIGTEILLGEITDTNSVFIARLLRDIGVNVYFMTSVGDNERRIADAIRIALSRADVVITCGGLGPTVDDMTRQAVAAATGRELVFHQDLLDKIAERFTTFRSQMTENNRRQAYLPEGALLIENPVGTAPAFAVEHDGKVVISLPGVPREMKFLMNERVAPYLRERYGLGGEIIKARVLKTAGIGESALDDLIGSELLSASNPTVGLAAHSGQVDVRITAKADSEAEANAMIDRVEAELRARIGDYLFGVDEMTIESALLESLAARDARLAVVEAGLMGAVSKRLAAANVNGDRLTGVQVFEHPNLLAGRLGHGSALTLRQMAERAAEMIATENRASVGIAVVGYPDVDESADVTEGSAIAVYTAIGTRSRAYGFGGRSDTAWEWTGTWAMSMAWRMLAEMGNAG